MPEWLFDVSAWVIPLVLAITLHEAAHGFVALKFGDRTAKDMGRVTFNPFKHIDRFGTIVLPGLLMLAQSPILFGYAKPVPVNFHQLIPPRKGMFAVALAGVAVNLMLAIASALMLHIEAYVTPEEAQWLFMNLYRSILINCVLIVVNLIPLLPLDGGRAVDALLHGTVQKAYRKIEPFGIFIVFAMLLAGPLLGLDIARYVIGEPATWLVQQVLMVTGNSQG